MKRKFFVFSENDGDEAVKTLKRENEALEFVSNVKNLHTYGCMRLEMRDEKGAKFKWDDFTEEWVRK